MVESPTTEHGLKKKCPAQSSVEGLQMSELLLPPPPQLLPLPPQLFNRIMVIIYWMMRYNGGDPLSCESNGPISVALSSLENTGFMLESLEGTWIEGQMSSKCRSLILFM